MGEEQSKTAVEPDDRGEKEWVIKIDDDRELIVFADDMLKIERVRTGAKTYLFENGRERAVAALRLTGEAQRGWPDWHIRLHWSVAGQVNE